MYLSLVVRETEHLAKLEVWNAANCLNVLKGILYPVKCLAFPNSDQFKENFPSVGSLNSI